MIKLRDYYIKILNYKILQVCIFLLLLLSRRWNQLISPQVWSEDGTQILYDFINESICSTFFKPVNGYMVISSKIISALSLTISFLHYPLVSTIITWLFIMGVCLAVSVSPTYLYGRFFCAVSIFLIPSDAEVFGLPLYSFWWASILIFLVALWDERQPYFFCRCLFLLLGGLSSPVILCVLPVFYIRSYIYREFFVEKILALLATIISMIQYLHIIKNQSTSTFSFYYVLKHMIPDFFGSFFAHHWLNHYVLHWIFGFFLIGICLFYMYYSNNKRLSFTLFYMLFSTLAVVMSRLNYDVVPHPFLAGPRYFFFLYIFISWILVQYVYTIKSNVYRYVIIGIMIFNVINTMPGWSRTHDNLYWQKHVYSCRFFSQYTIPIQCDGSASRAWGIQLSGSDCLAWLKKDIFFNKKSSLSSTFAYTVKQNYTNLSKFSVQLISNSMLGSDYQKSEIIGYNVIGSYHQSDHDTGEVKLKIHKNSHILYRSGPNNQHQSLSIDGFEEKFISKPLAADNWVALLFENSQLPEEFVVIIKDEGSSFGEWSAVAIPTFK